MFNQTTSKVMTPVGGVVMCAMHVVSEHERDAMTTTTTSTASTEQVLTIAHIEQSAIAEQALAEHAISWTTKSGRSIARHSPIGAISAPKSVQVHSAIDATTAQWCNGQFKPFTRDVRANLSDKQALAIADKCTLTPTNKADSSFFLECALYELTHKTVKNIVTEVTPKGEKARIVATIQAILE